MPLQGHSGYIPERVAIFKRALVAAGISLDVPLTVGIDGLSLRAGLWYSPSRRSVAGHAYVWSDDITPARMAVDPVASLPPSALGGAASAPPAAGAPPAKQPYRSAFEGLLATHAEVVIIRDASGRHSTSVGFYPLEAENGQALAAIVLEVVTLLTEAGLRPACVAWDGGAGNRSAWRFLTGAPTANTLPVVGGICPSAKASVDDIVRGVQCSFANPADPTRRVYIVFDPEHVLKRHRNALESSRPDLGDKAFSWQFPAGPVVASWDHVRQAYHRDQAESGGQRHSFLSYETVFLTGAGRLNVSYASTATGERLISSLRELGQRPRVDAQVSYDRTLSSGPPSPGAGGAAGGAAAGADAMGPSAPVAVPYDGFTGNPFRATYTYLRTCRIIFDGTFQPVFIRSTANPGLRAAWTAAVSLAEQAAASKAAGRPFISHMSVSDPLVTCASFYGVMRDYVEPLIVDGSTAFPGLYGRALSSTLNERYYGEMRGGRSAGFASGAMNAGDAARRDAILSVHAGGPGVCSAQVRGSNVLSFWDTGHSGVHRPASDDDTAGGTALSLKDTVALLHPPHSAASARAASERAVCIRSSYEWVSVDRNPAVPKQRLRLCKYIKGPKCTVLCRRVQQSPPLASWTSVWHGLLGERSTVSGYAALRVSRCGPGTAHLSSKPAYRACLEEMLSECPEGNPQRQGARFMLMRTPGAVPVSIDDLPVAYVDARILIFDRWLRKGVSSDHLHRPSLLMIALIERMVQVVQPHLRVAAVVEARAAYVQRLEGALVADEELRRLAHVALAGAGCGPIGNEPRTGPGSEDAAYEFLASLVGPFVLGQWQKFRCTRLAHEISAMEEGSRSKEGTLATLRSKAATANRKVVKREEKEKFKALAAGGAAAVLAVAGDDSAAEAGGQAGVVAFVLGAAGRGHGGMEEEEEEAEVVEEEPEEEDGDAASDGEADDVAPGPSKRARMSAGRGGGRGGRGRGRGTGRGSRRGRARGGRGRQ